MTTTKSSSKNRLFSIYKASLKSQFAFFIISGVLSVLSVPLTFVASISGEQRYVRGLEPELMREYYQRLFTSGVYATNTQMLLVMIALAAVAVAAALVGNSYFHSKKQVDLYHSLPVTRPTMLTANMLASLTAVAAPFSAVYLLTMVGQLVIYGRFGCFGSTYFAFSFLQYATMLVYLFVVYIFTTFVAVNVGTMFDTFAIAGVLGFLPSVTYLVGGYLWQQLTYGAIFSQASTYILSPFLFPLKQIAYSDYTYAMGHVYEYGPMLLIVLVWLVLGLGLYFASLACYRNRKSEIAGQTQPRGVFQRIVYCFAAFGGAIMFYVVLQNLPLVVQIVLMLAGGALVGLVAAIIFSRGVKQLLANIACLVGGGVLAVCLLLMLQLDVLGFQKSIPRAEEVQSVTITYDGRFSDLGHYYARSYAYSSSIARFGISAYRESALKPLTNRESIQVVLDMHRLAVEDFPQQGIGYSYWDQEGYSYYSLSLTYELNNGKKVVRYFDMVNFDALQVLADLEDKEDFIAGRSPVFLLEDAQYIDQASAIRSVTVADPYTARSETAADLDDATCRRLLTAVQQDLLGQSLSEIKNPTEPPLGYLKIEYLGYNELYRRYGYMDSVQDDIELYNSFYSDEAYTGIALTGEFRQTLEVLAQLGLSGPLEARQPDRLYVLPTHGVGMCSDYRVNAAFLGDRYQGSYVVEIISAYKDGTLEDWYRYTDDMPLQVFRVEDSGEIRQVEESAFSQGFLADGLDYVLIVAEFEDSVYGYKYLPIDQLPASVREDVRQYLNLRLSGLQYDESGIAVAETYPQAGAQGDGPAGEIPAMSESSLVETAVTTVHPQLLLLAEASGSKLPTP